MPKSKLQKSNELKKLGESIAKAKTIVFAGFSRVTMPESQQLRKALKDESGEIIISKKSLIDRAFADKGIKDADAKGFEGSVAVVFAYGDEVAPVKALDKFRTETEDKVVFYGGYLDGEKVDAKGIYELAKVPGREELYARVVGSLNAPISGFANVLAGTMRGFVYALKAIEEKKA